MLKEIIEVNGNFSELAKKRFSCRTFDGNGVEEEKLNLVKKQIGKANESSGNFIAGIVDKHELKAKRFFTTGTYGMFKGDRFYIVGILNKKSEFDWVKYGFLMENIIIYLTQMGLNTCWIGGVFDRKGFGSELGIKEDELVPAIIPFGYCASKRTLRDKIVRWSAKGDKRKTFEKLFFIKENPENLSETKLKEVLENVRIAPSASNKQPWRFFIYKNRIDLYLKRDKLYSKLVPSADLQMIDMGIVSYHLWKSFSEIGVSGRWNLLKNKESFSSLQYIVSFIF